MPPGISRMTWRWSAPNWARRLKAAVESLDSNSLMNKPSFRMIAIDLDGTLLAPDGTVTPRTKKAVRRAVEAGMVVCFATGRSMRESEMILKEVDHRDVGVFVTGAMVIDTSNGHVIHRKLMHADLARELCGFLEERNQTVLALQDSRHAGLDYLVTD